MSAMAEMIVNMLLKELPPETREALKPENLQRYANNAKSEYDWFKKTLIDIQEQNETILEILGRLSNDDGSSSGKRTGKLRAIAGGAGSGGDGGSDGNAG